MVRIDSIGRSGGMGVGGSFGTYLRRFRAAGAQIPLDAMVETSSEHGVHCVCGGVMMCRG
jgi:hypothetical protein